jgi:ketosteroid isomerase-like protein
MIKMRPGLLLLPLLLFAACSRTPDETLIRQSLDQMVASVEQRQPKEVVSHLTDDFLAQDQMGVDEIRRFMIAQFFRNQQINILITDVHVEVQGLRARVLFRAAISGGANWLPERLEYYQLTTQWQKTGGDWKMQNATWEPVLAAG